MAHSCTLKMVIVWLSEMLNCYQPTLRHVLEDSNLHLIRIVYIEL